MPAVPLIPAGEELQAVLFVDDHVMTAVPFDTTTEGVADTVTVVVLGTTGVGDPVVVAGALMPPPQALSKQNKKTDHMVL